MGLQEEIFSKNFYSKQSHIREIQPTPCPNTLSRTIPYLNTLSGPIPYVNTLSRPIPYLNTLSRTMPYPNTLSRISLKTSRQPIKFEYFVTRELSAIFEDFSRLSARVGSL